MPDWSSYGLSDFLLFSAETYFRLIAQYNRDVWPAHAAASLAGLFLLWAAFRPTATRMRVALILLGCAWLAATYLFVWQRYATINWAVSYIVPVMITQGALLLAFGALRSPACCIPPSFAGRATALAVLAVAVVLYPLLAPLAGYSFAQAESFGLMPAPTSAATLAILALVQTRWALGLMTIPLVWCLISALTLWTLGTPMFAAPLILALLAVCARLLVSSGQKRQTRS